METIGSSSLWSFLNSSEEKAESPISCGKIREDGGHFVKDYLELATKVAHLQFRNREHVLLFRGQASDYRDSKNMTTIKPSIFRGSVSVSRSGPKLLSHRFELLSECEEILMHRYVKRKFLDPNRLRKQTLLRWAILQHYEVCATPLLDVTQSLRVAASFASNSNNLDEGFVMVLGVPNISGAVTASDEASLQIVRLASACPPEAVRPHVQEGFLLGEYPGMMGARQMHQYQQHEMDFGRRLVAKFRFKPSSFWKNDAFPPVQQDALYPNANDPLFELARSIQPTSGAE